MIFTMAIAPLEIQALEIDPRYGKVALVREIFN